MTTICRRSFTNDNMKLTMFFTLIIFFPKSNKNRLQIDSRLTKICEECCSNRLFNLYVVRKLDNEVAQIYDNSTI